jgi:hypothetical protein
MGRQVKDRESQETCQSQSSQMPSREGWDESDPGFRYEDWGFFILGSDEESYQHSNPHQSFARVNIFIACLFASLT